jgi:hypothetical protein
MWNIPLIMNLAENDLQQLEEGRLFLESICDMDVVVTDLEGE